MYVTIKPGTPTVSQNVYHINNVYIYSNFRLNSAQQDTAKLLAAAR